MKRIIAYDLVDSTGSDYQDLYDVLDELNRTRINESTYWIDTELSQTDIINKIAAVIDKNDKVFYISVSSRTNKLFADRIVGTKSK